jgi:hypothetical protein
MYYDPALNPGPSSLWYTNAPGAAATPPPIDALLRINANRVNCKTLLDSQGYLTGPCQQYLPSMNQAFGRGIGGGGLPVGSCWSNVDKVKGDVLAMFAGDDQRGSVTAPSTPSGLAVLKRGRARTPVFQPGGEVMPISTNTNPATGQPTTAWDLLNVAGNCATTTVVDEIFQRCREIQPRTTRGEVIALLNSHPGAELPLTTAGSRCYIYLPNSDLAGSLAVSRTAPSQVRFPGLTPDGIASPSSACSFTQYGLLQQGLVNTGDSGGPGDNGDAGLHDRPYRRWSGGVNGDFQTRDRAIWTPSSGFRSLLGSLEFSNETAGTMSFSKPN